MTEQRRSLRNWIHGYLDFVYNQESPAIFHIWTALWAIGLVLGRKCYFDKGYYKVYPNLYIILVAESAHMRKSTAIEMPMKFVLNKLNTPPPFLPETITPERIINKIALQTLAPVVDEFGVVTNPNECVSQCNFVASELMNLIGEKANNAKMIVTISELYSCKDVWINETIKRGSDTLFNVFATFMGATTVDWLKGCLSKEHMQGGFGNRFIWVYEKTYARDNPFPKFTEDMRVLTIGLINDMNIILEMSGEFKQTKEACTWYENWYVKFRDSCRYAPNIIDGYLGRKHDHLIKLAMILSASRNNSMLIEKNDYRLAERIMNRTEKFMPELFQDLIIRSEDSKAINYIDRTLRRFYDGVLESKLLNLCWREIGTQERFMKVLNTLIYAGVAIREISKNGNHIIKPVRCSAVKLPPGITQKHGRKVRLSNRLGERELKKLVESHETSQESQESTVTKLS